jgi:hemerythrin-like domain-containing protein
MKITEALCTEHLVFHHMFDHVEVTASEMKTLGELKAVAAVIESLLRAHGETENELFIGPLEHCFEQLGQRDALIEEHHEMDENFDSVRNAKQLATARKLLLAAVTHSRQHFDREERIVFPMAERLLKTETLEALGQAWMEKRTRMAVAV